MNAQAKTGYLTSMGSIGKRVLSLLALLALVLSPTARATVSQVPLTIGGGGVPGNLALAMSVEWPTVNSVANLGSYDETQTYAGYFDSAKCYKYHYDSSNSDNDHFYPTSITANHRCSGAWSGNFLNWATTQTIDPFRKALTGGYRVKDTPTTTWLQKARDDGQGGTGDFPDRRIPDSGNNSSLVSGATPFQADSLKMRIEGLGARMYFRIDNDNPNYNVVNYDPSQAISSSHAYQVYVRVKVCDPNVGVESDCVQYDQGWKPEGLIQQHADNIRFSVFGYLNESNYLRDGGVLRAQQQFVGQQRLTPGVGWESNPAAEWDPKTGVLVQNPDPTSASATDSSIDHSGVINYINEFGELNDNNHKSFDPVSELYYTALRYFENLGNVPAYSDVSSASSYQEKQKWWDNFPVITNWDDPIVYACQKNVILGIGDVNTHRDKNLPGNDTYLEEEPPKPPQVAADHSVNVLTLTDQVGQMEGIGNIGDTNSFSGRYNSAYMAGLAYYAHTHDIRPNMSGDQSISTYWVDVLEGQVQQPPRYNQFYLAAKYGGFDIPKNYDPAQTSALPVSEWHTTSDTFVANNGITYDRPDNYYTAGRAQKMIESLNQAFENIATEIQSSAASVSSNGNKLTTDSMVYQPRFDSQHWSGQLLAYKLDANGQVASTPTWDAAAQLDSLTDSQAVNNRDILTSAPPTTQTDGTQLSTQGADFQWNSLSSSQQADLEVSSGTSGPVSSMVAQERLNYLRGSRQFERTATNLSAPFRQRASRLGDIINSTPQYVYHQDFGYSTLSNLSEFSTISSYSDFRASSTYQNRPPVVIVGANDGMLHGFRADTNATDGGKELFAYVPASVYPNLYRLTDPRYSHHYYVDGTPRIADAWLGASKGWRTLAVGSTGAGGNSIFALDVTDPTNMKPSDVLWEFTDPAMGKTIEQPAIVPLADGKFGVVVTSGYDSGASSGKIWILDASDGKVIHTFDVPTSSSLGSPLVVDLNNDRVADRIYVADTAGEIWRFDVNDSSTANWGPPATLESGGKAVPLFVAKGPNGNAQAITAPLTAALNQNKEPMLFFGTGSYVNVGDNVLSSNPQINSFYGIIDRGQPISGRSTLLEQSIVAAQTDNQNNLIRAVSANQISASDNGWYIDLAYNGIGNGERVVAQAQVRDDRIIFPTLIPSANPCQAGGSSILMELNAFSGGRLDYSVYDMNNDGVYDQKDNMTIGQGKNQQSVPVSGKQLGIGIVGSPTIIGGAPGGNEVKIFSGSSGQIRKVNERGGGVVAGRQSWQQLR